MEASRHDHSLRPFVLKTNDLRKLATEFQNRFDKVSFEIECSDRLSRRFSDVQELLDYENGASRSIQALTIEGRNQDYSTRVSLQLSSKVYGNVQIAIQGASDLVTKTSEFIDERLSGMSPWYSLMAKADYVGFLPPLLLVAAILVGGAFVAFSPVASPTTQSSTARDTLRGTLIGYALCGLSILSGWALEWSRSRLFPIATFATGQGEQRFDNLEKIRWTIVVGFIVSVGASIAVALLFNLGR